MLRQKQNSQFIRPNHQLTGILLQASPRSLRQVCTADSNHHKHTEITQNTREQRNISLSQILLKHRFSDSVIQTVTVTLELPASIDTAKTPFTRYNRLSNRLLSTGCQTGCCVKPVVVKPVVKRFDNRVERTDCSFNRLSNQVVQRVWQPAVYTIHVDTAVLSNRLSNNVCIHDTTGCQTGLTTGCIV